MSNIKASLELTLPTEDSSFFEENSYVITEEICLTPFLLRDIPCMVAVHQRSSDIHKYTTTVPASYSEDDAINFLSKVKSDMVHPSTGKCIKFVIRRRDTSEFIGLLGIYRSRNPKYKQEEEWWSLGYSIAAEWTGKGIVTACVHYAMQELGFKELGIRNWEAATLTGNMASRRVLEKCGYRLLEDEIALDKVGTAEKLEGWSFECVI
ncbi:hypothetical protein K7432_015064 [Basidiobolus ranarum]|uniref:N-acetyltransferase domain-containing protein n=1 Tax=Basidiobolus ranarum TaxID=34480 RepID=A0ABR2VNR9_9FUNG